jgi:hypothetical protein
MKIKKKRVNTRYLNKPVSEEVDTLKTRSTQIMSFFIIMTNYIARSSEVLGWEGVGNGQLLRIFKA